MYNLLLNMRLQTLIFVGVVIVCAFPSVSHAEIVIRSGSTVTVESRQILDSDFYGLAETITVSGAANHDVLLIGGSVTLNAPVASDLLVVGGNVQVHGDVGDDVRIIGGEVVIANTIKGDLVVVGGVLTVLSTAEITGDVYFLGGEATISGTVGGSVLGAAERLRIDTQVGGDVSVQVTDTLTLGDQSDVGGNVMYKSDNELIRSQSSVVVGTITKTKSINTQTTEDLVRSLILQTLVVLFAVLVLFLIARGVLQRLTEGSLKTHGYHGLLGIVVFFLIPFVSILLLTSILGTLVGLVLLSAYVLLLIVSWILIGVLLGSFLQKLIFKKETVTLLTVVAGTVCASLLLLIPVVGLMVIGILFFTVIGGIVARVYHLLR